MAQPSSGPDPSPRSQWTIANITVEGAQATDPQAIIALSGLQVGESIVLPSLQTAQAIDALWRLQRFSNVTLYESHRQNDSIHLIISVEEAPIIGGYKLTGLRKNWRDQLLESLEKTAPLGTAYTRSVDSHLQTMLTDHCAEKGYPSAVVQRQWVDNPEGIGQILHLHIVKGDVMKIEQISFSGNEQIKAGKLRKLMQHSKRRIHLWSKSRFVEEKYREDLEAIRQHYRSKGYLDAAIGRDSSWVDASGDLHLHIHIEEGQQYHIRSLRWQGNDLYDEELLNRILGFGPGDVYRPEELESRLHFHPEGRDVASLYMDRGHLFFRAELVEKAIEGDSLDLEIRLTEGPLAVIGRVEISGNETTKDYVIRRELETRPGQYFSRAAIMRSQRRLMNMGFFDPNNFDIRTQIHPEKGTVDIEYVLQEKSGDKFELAGGWDPASKSVFGTLGVAFQNFSMRDLFKKGSWTPYPQGDGQQLSFRVQSSGRDFQSYNFSFSEPWFRGKPRQLTVAGFLTRRNQELEEGLTARYSVIGGLAEHGARFRFLDDYIVSGSSVQFQQIRLQDWELQDFVLEDGTPLANGTFNNLFFRQEFTYTNLNHPFFPTKGRFLSLSVQFTPPYSLFGSGNSSEHDWLEYHKWRLEATQHIPLGNKLTLRASAKAGYLGSYGGDISPFERFRLGGDGLNRLNGYTGVDVIALRGYDEEVDFAVNQKGGATLFNKYTLELRYLLLDQPASSAYVHAFAEAGNAWQGFDGYNPFDLKRSVGVGFRVKIPMLGLVGMDYGIGFDKTGSRSGSYLSRFGKVSLVIGIEPD